MADPFTLRIFVPDGDPEGVRLIDRMNWTGLGLVFRRSDWPQVRNRDHMDGIGVYLLVGYRNSNNELRTWYVGQADGLKTRIDSHYKEKDFWDRAVVFVSTSGGLNRAHITWLEYALVKRLTEAKRCLLDNAVLPKESKLTEAEKADTKGFVKEILQILPLVGLHAFDVPKIAVDPNDVEPEGHDNRDTIVVPANDPRFAETFLGEDSWYAIRMSGGMLCKIKYIAAYRTAPVSAITHVASVSHIEPYGESGKYKVVFSGSAERIERIPYGDAKQGTMQSPRYASYERLKKARTLPDVFESG